MYDRKAAHINPKEINWMSKVCLWQHIFLATFVSVDFIVSYSLSVSKVPIHPLLQTLFRIKEMRAKDVRRKDEE